MTKLFNLYIAFIALLVFFQCKPQTNEPDHEVIQQVTLRCLSPTDTAEASWKDPDGDGGVAPVWDTLRWKSGQTYQCILLVKGTVDGKEQDITENIRLEGTAHRVFYSTDLGMTNLQSIIRDMDTQGKPLGLKVDFIVPPIVANGNLNVKLSHYDGVKTDSPSAENDIDISFPLVIR